MADKNSMNKILNWKLGQIKQFGGRLKEVVDSYVSKITGSAQMWIDRSEDYNQQSFVEVTMQLDQAMFLLTEKSSEIESGLASQLLDASAPETTLKAATPVSSQINVRSQAVDPSLCSLQERMHSLESLVGSVQASLDRCRKQVGSVEGMKANLENLTSLVEGITNDTSLQQIQREIEHYKSKEVVRMDKFEDQLLKIENSSSKFDHRLTDLETRWEKTDDRAGKMDDKLTEMETEIMQVKLQNEAENKQIKLQIEAVAQLRENESEDVKKIQEHLTKLETDISDIKDNKLQSLDDRLKLKDEDMKATQEQERKQEIAAAIKERQLRHSLSGFIAMGLRASLYSPGVDFSNLEVFALSTDILFNKNMGQFTAPVDGAYLVILIYQCLADSMDISVIHSEHALKIETRLFTADTFKQKIFTVGRSLISMRAGDTLTVSISRQCIMTIPVFSCVHVG